MLRKVSLALAALALSAAPAAAQEVSFGTRVVSILNETWGPLFVLIASVSMVGGLACLAKGLLKLRDSAQPGGRGGFGEGAAWVVAAAMLISLPDAAGVGLATMFGANDRAANLESISQQVDTAGGNGFASTSDSQTTRFIKGIVAPPAPVNCLGGNDAPATCMAANLAKNAAPIAVVALFAVVFLAGLVSFAGAIVDVAKSQGSGQGRMERGWATKLATSVLLMNAPFFFLTVTRTLLGADDMTTTLDGINAGSSMLSYTPVGGDPRFAKFAELIEHSFTILVFFGAWAFVRGIFMMKASAEGRGQATVAMAAVYMVAGALLANAKFSTCMILYTVAGSDGQMGFCS